MTKDYSGGICSRSVIVLQQKKDGDLKIESSSSSIADSL